jgi:hypothetical protein
MLRKHLTDFLLYRLEPMYIVRVYSALRELPEAIARLALSSNLSHSDIDLTSLFERRQCLTTSSLGNTPCQLSRNHIQVPLIDMGTTRIPTRATHDIRCTNRDDDDTARTAH